MRTRVPSTRQPSRVWSLSSQSDIYFTAAAAESEVLSGGSSKGASAHNSPQTPPGGDAPVFLPSLGEGESRFHCLVQRFLSPFIVKYQHVTTAQGSHYLKP